MPMLGPVAPPPFATPIPIRTKPSKMSPVLDNTNYVMGGILQAAPMVGSAISSAISPSQPKGYSGDYGYDFFFNNK